PYHPSHAPSLFSLTDPAPTEIYTLSLHDALPISGGSCHHIAADQYCGGRGDQHDHAKSNPPANLADILLGTGEELSRAPILKEGDWHFQYQIIKPYPHLAAHIGGWSNCKHTTEPK